jgi:hypothetical protein
MIDTRKQIQEVEILTPTEQATTDTYADVVGSIIDTKWRASLAIILKNTDTADDLDWKILGSIDGVTYVEVVAEATVQENTVGTPYAVSNPPYRYYKVQVKSTSSGNPAKATVHLIAK